VPTKFDTWNYTIIEGLLAGLTVVTSASAGAAVSINESNCLIVYEGGFDEFLQSVKEAMEKPRRNSCVEYYDVFNSKSMAKAVYSGILGGYLE
jgi:hypothetical protein